MRSSIILILFLLSAGSAYADKVISTVSMSMKDLDLKKMTDLVIEEHADRLVIKNSFEKENEMVSAEKTFEKDGDFAALYKNIWGKLDLLKAWELRSDPKPDSLEGMFEVKFHFKRKGQNKELTAYVSKNGVDPAQPAMSEIGRLFDIPYRFVTELYTRLVGE